MEAVCCQASSMTRIRARKRAGDASAPGRCRTSRISARLPTPASLLHVLSSSETRIEPFQAFPIIVTTSAPPTALRQQPILPFQLSASLKQRIPPGQESKAELLLASANFLRISTCLPSRPPALVICHRDFQEPATDAEGLAVPDCPGTHCAARLWDLSVSAGLGRIRLHCPDWPWH